MEDYPYEADFNGERVRYRIEQGQIVLHTGDLLRVWPREAPHIEMRINFPRPEHADLCAQNLQDALTESYAKK